MTTTELLEFTEETLQKVLTRFDNERLASDPDFGEVVYLARVLATACELEARLLRELGSVPAIRAKVARVLATACELEVRLLRELGYELRNGEE